MPPGGEGADALILRRRDLLVRAGVIGAGAVVAGVWPRAVQADVPEALEPLLERIAQPALDLLSRDTYSGLAVFAVPGPDAYSRAQGLTSPTPGGIEAKAHQLVPHTLDFFVAWPDNYIQALAAAFSTGVSDVPLPTSLITPLLKPLELVGATLDDALQLILRNDRTIPVSLPLALLMNMAATEVRATSVLGPIPSSPFANLTYREKGQAFQLIEEAHPNLVALVDSAAPQPLHGSASGLLRFVGGILLTLAPFGGYGEYGVFDRRTRRVTRRPVGWDLSRYMPGRTTPADGWAEFIGYYQGRRAVQNAPEYGGG